MKILPVFITVETVEPPLRTDPDIPVGIFQETGDPAAGGFVGHLNALLVDKTDRRCAASAHKAYDDERKGYRFVLHRVKIMLSSQSAKHLNKSSESVNESFKRL